jgi:polyisoprenyl-phosphate glycosyltransferase
LSAACRSCVNESHEIILVDDGSSDRTWDIITDLGLSNHNIVGIKLLRNHGHQLAASAGLSNARGQRVLLIDADLQDPPELLPQLMKIMDDGADVVYGQRRTRAGENQVKLKTADAFYRVLSKLSTVSIPKDTGDFRLMSRRVVDVLCSMPERQRFLRGMVAWIGGNQVAYPYARDPRYSGVSKYPFSKMVRLAVDAITSFSALPLRLASWLGAATAVVSILLMIYSIRQWMLGHTLDGWTSLITAMTLFSSVQMLLLGVIGEYLGRLYEENKARPLFMIDKIVKTPAEKLLASCKPIGSIGQ